MRASSFQPNISLPLGVPSPDFFEIGARVPADDFVVSRRRDGTVASRYGDNAWDVSPWLTKANTSKLVFDFWPGQSDTAHRIQLRADAKNLLFAMIWLKGGAPFAVNSLLNYMPFVRNLVRYADEISCRLPEILANEKLLCSFADTRLPKSMAKSLNSMLSHLARIGVDVLGFEVVKDSVREVLQAHTRTYTGALQQHTPIPTRIYSTILSRLSGELSDWEPVANEALALLSKCGSDPLYGRSRDVQREIWGSNPVELKYRPDWSEAASAQLQQYLATKGDVNTIKGLSSAATQVQQVAKLVVQAYSGMRDDEALSLHYECAESTVSSQRTHLVICGATTKLAKGVKRARWVTNQEGHRAIAIAQKIADVVYAICYRQTSQGRKSRAKMLECPLFVSINYLGLAAKARAIPDDGLFFAASLDLSRFNRLRERILPVIEECDLLELEKIDSHRAWRAEPLFSVGATWALLTHQLRRSLALYAQRSGLVSLPSLRQQLQHLTEEMSRYYSRGSVYAKDVFGDDDPDPEHFGLEWQAAQCESAGMSYVLNVLLTDEPLFGGHATFVSQRLQNPEGSVSAQTRSETMTMFKRGELHYKETIIGGCTKSGDCDMPVLDWLNTACITKNCGNLVGRVSTLRQIVAEQEKLVASLPTSSLLYRTENANLVALSAAYDKASQ